MLRCVFLTVGLALLGQAAQAQTVLFNQSSDPLTSGADWNSSTVNFAQGFAVYDDFVLTQAAEVTRLSWRGIYLDFANRGNNPIPANSVSWRILIDGNSLVGATNYPVAPPLYDTTFSAAAVTTTFVGTKVLVGLGDTVNVYDMSVDLPTPFRANAGVRYWFSPISIQPNSNTLWAWHAGGGGGSGAGVAHQYRWTSRTTDDYAGQRTNRAFAISGSPIPAPGALLTGLVGSVPGVCLLLRRRSRGRAKVART